MNSYQLLIFHLQLLVGDRAHVFAPFVKSISPEGKKKFMFKKIGDAPNFNE